MSDLPEPLTIGAIRKRPGMYVGDTGDGSGILHMVLEVVANAFDQYLAGRCTRITIGIEADDTSTVEDDGPGIPAEGRDRLPGLENLFEERSEQPTVDGHRPHVHLGLGAIGLAVVNALSERFEVTTVCGGQEAVAVYTCGEPARPLEVRRVDGPSGTRVRFRPDPRIFATTRIPRVELARELEDLSFLAPGLTLSWSVAGDRSTQRGLAARVASRAGRLLGGVAHHRGSYETPSGPIDVEVALGWRDGDPRWLGAAVIDSFVNLARTREHGQHVIGLRDGLRAFLPKVTRRTDGLFAAVAVMLSDVKYGKPSRDRLDTAEARPAVAAATRVALAGWAEAWPDAAAALRRRGDR